MLKVYIGDDVILDSDILLDSDMLLQGSEKLTAADSIFIEKAIDERSTLRVGIVDELNRLHFEKGMPVDVYDDDELEYSGVIDTAIKRKISRYFVHDLTCVDWRYLADKRVMAKAYTDTYAGDIVEDIITNYLSDEEVTAGIIQRGPLISEAIFNYIPISDALNSIAEKANFTWDIDKYKKLNFMERGAKIAPFPVSNKDMKKDSIQFVNGNPQYRNKQYIRGGKDITDPQTQSFKGDGVNKTFVVGYPIAKVPTITLNGNPQTVGIRGLEENKQWYWAKGDNTITQDDSATPINTTDTLSVTYQGEFDIVVINISPEEVEARKAIEGGGTGLVEDVFDDRSISTRDAAFELANAKINRYGKISNKVRFLTTLKGLEPGQLLTVTLPEYGLNNTQMLIERVTVATEGRGQTIWYDVVAVEGAMHSSWSKMFYSMATIGQVFVIRENIREEQVLVTLEQFYKTWLEAETPNVFYEVYPGENTLPGVLPMFDPAHRVRSIALVSDTEELVKKTITKQITSDGEILSTTFINSYEGNGNITKVRWYGGYFNNIIVDEQDFVKEKTELEAIQIDKTDIKGW